jgi:hypothetical protein
MLSNESEESLNVCYQAFRQGPGVSGRAGTASI